MTEHTENEPAVQIKDVKTNPCGCKLTEFEDGSRLYHPCPPCGIFQAAESMQDASKALRSRWPFGRRKQAAVHVQRAAMAFAAVATTLQNEQLQAVRRQQLAEMIKGAAKAAEEGGDVLPGPGSDPR